MRNNFFRKNMTSFETSQFDQFAASRNSNNHSSERELDLNNWYEYFPSTNFRHLFSKNTFSLVVKSAILSAEFFLECDFTNCGSVSLLVGALVPDTACYILIKKNLIFWISAASHARPGNRVGRFWTSQINRIS